MSAVKLDGYCGLYCGACDVFRLTEKSRQTGLAAKWEEMPEQFKKVIKEADVICHGCKSDTVFAGCLSCPIVKCAKKKRVESCALCPKYPCLLIKVMYVVVRLRKLDKKLPHSATRKPNLEFIRKNGLASFLCEQERAWSCPQCGSRLSWYRKQCSCGKDNKEYFGTITGKM